MYYLLIIIIIFIIIILLSLLIKIIIKLTIIPFFHYFYLNFLLFLLKIYIDKSLFIIETFIKNFSIYYLMKDKKPLRELLGKNVVTKEGRRLGIVKDISFDTKTGELISLLISSPTTYTNSLNLEQTKEGEILIPYHSLLAIGDFVVVNEEDLV